MSKHGNISFSEMEEKRREQEEILWLKEMDEDEYDALPDNEKAKVDEKRLQIKKERIKKYVILFFPFFQVKVEKKK